MSVHSNHKFKPISNIVAEVVSKHLPTGDIEALSKQLDRIVSCWPRCCNELLSQNIKPIRLDGNVLIVETHSPVWANKMRYSIKSTLSHLNKLGFNQIDTIKVQVNPRISKLIR